MAVFFEDSAMRCFHTTLRLGNQGCRTVLARIHVGWLFCLKNPVCGRDSSFVVKSLEELCRAGLPYPELIQPIVSGNL